MYSYYSKFRGETFQMAPNTQQMVCVSCCYLSHPQGQTPISSSNDTGDVQRLGVQVVSKVMLPSVEGLGFELKTVRDLSPSTWPPRYRTSPDSTRAVSFPDITHYGMDPQKTQLHHWSVLSEENPEASQGEGDESWTGAAPCRWRQSLPGDTKYGKAYLDRDRKCDVWFIKKKLTFPIYSGMSFVPPPNLLEVLSRVQALQRWKVNIPECEAVRWEVSGLRKQSGKDCDPDRGSKQTDLRARAETEPFGKQAMLLFKIKWTGKGLLWAQWPGLHIPNAGGPGSILSQGTRAHMLQLRVCMLQLKIPHVKMKTPCSQINKQIK